MANSNYRTPYFKIFVSKGGKGDSFIELPRQIARLIGKVEIQEVMNSKCGLSQATLVINEGSREPYKRNSVTSDLYKVSSTDVTDYFSNDTGMVVDLVFNGSGGITSLIKSATAADSAVKNIAGNLANAANSSGEQFTYETTAPKGQPNFVFKEGTLLKIEWGYKPVLNQPVLNRSVVFQISMLRTTFPDNGMPTTEVTARSLSEVNDQLVPLKPITFSNTVPSGIDLTTGKVQVDKQDATTKDVLQAIANYYGAELIISKSLSADKVADGQKVWTTAESLNQFLAKLAERHFALYGLEVAPKSDKRVLYFLTREDYYKSSIIQESLMYYKAQGSILKSVNVVADFGKMQGKGTTGLDDKGNKITQATDTSVTLPLYAQQELAKGGVENSTAAQALIKSTGGAVGRVEYHPESKSSGNAKQIASAGADCSLMNTITLEFTTVGWPKLHCGAAPFLGLGKRYSGYYFIQQVTHTIDAAGYSCKGMAMGHALGGGGTKPAAPEGVPKEENVQLDLFSPVKKLAALTDPTQQFKDEFGLV